MVVSAGVALCATINASPDNHMYMANSGNVRHVVDALMIVASADRTRISAALSRHLDLACAELTTVLSVLSRYCSLSLLLWLSLPHDDVSRLSSV